MTKQEYMAMSLPHGLKVIFLYDVCRYSGMKYIFEFQNAGGAKSIPICRPLSDLTKSITHEGETFMPAIKLAKIVANIYNDDMDSKWIVRDDGRVICKTPWDLHISIYYKTETIMFSVYDMWNRQEKRTHNQFVAFQNLISWHFDIAGLIEKGEAIDVNTLSKNPYA